MNEKKNKAKKEKYENQTKEKNKERKRKGERKVFFLEMGKGFSHLAAVRSATRFLCTRWTGLPVLVFPSAFVFPLPSFLPSFLLFFLYFIFTFFLYSSVYFYFYSLLVPQFQFSYGSHQARGCAASSLKELEESLSGWG